MVSWDDSSVWLVSTLVFFGLMPLWKKRRAYFISAGILFFPPAFILYQGTGYYSIWPWIVSFPGYLLYFSESWLLFLNYVLPTNLIVGFIFWAIAVWRKI